MFQVEHKRPRIFGNGGRQSGDAVVHVLLQGKEYDQHAAVADERRRDQVRGPVFVFFVGVVLYDASVWLQVASDDADAAAVLREMEVGRGPRQAFRINGTHRGRQRIAEAKARQRLDGVVRGRRLYRVRETDEKQLNVSHVPAAGVVLLLLLLLSTGVRFTA